MLLRHPMRAAYILLLSRMLRVSVRGTGRGSVQNS